MEWNLGHPEISEPEWKEAIEKTKVRQEYSISSWFISFDQFMYSVSNKLFSFLWQS